jgi:hypothetical protein
MIQTADFHGMCLVYGHIFTGNNRSLITGNTSTAANLDRLEPTKLISEPKSCIFQKCSNIFRITLSQRQIKPRGVTEFIYGKKGKSLCLTKYYVMK